MQLSISINMSLKKKALAKKTVFFGSIGIYTSALSMSHYHTIHNKA
jgi:hypothetical protein